MTRYFYNVLESEIPAFEAVGWHDDGLREYRPSVREPVAIMEIWCEGLPPLAPSQLPNEEIMVRVIK